MSLPLVVVGVSHHTAPVEVRERMAFSPSESARALLSLRERGLSEEAVLLSTCNRTEIYLFPVRSERAVDEAERLLAAKAGPLARPYGEYVFRQRGEGVVRHLFQVCSGLDSLVLGEAEIQGQVRDAYELAAGLGTDPPLAGRFMNRLFQMALAVGGEVRAGTAIAEGAASVASVGVELAGKIFGSLRDKRVLILGAGATAELVLDALAREGVQGVVVANRTYDRAVRLAERLDGRAVRMERIAEALPHVDIVLSSTAAPHPVLTRQGFRRAFAEGRRHPLLIIDLAVPRDVDPAVGEEPEVFLYNVDDLRKIVDEHVRARSRELPEANRIIAEHSAEFQGWYASLEVVPVIRGMRDRAEAHRSAELDRLLRGMEHLGKEDRERVEEFSRRLLRKVLHDPTVRLRRGMAGGGGRELVDAVRFLYGIEGRDEGGGERERREDAPPGPTEGKAADLHHGAGE